jgi:hypothetical protein
MPVTLMDGPESWTQADDLVHMGRTRSLTIWTSSDSATPYHTFAAVLTTEGRQEYVGPFGAGVARESRGIRSQADGRELVLAPESGVAAVAPFVFTWESGTPTSLHRDRCRITIEDPTGGKLVITAGERIDKGNIYTWVPASIQFTGSLTELAVVDIGSDPRKPQWPRLELGDDRGVRVVKHGRLYSL